MSQCRTAVSLGTLLGAIAGAHTWCFIRLTRSGLNLHALFWLLNREVAFPYLQREGHACACQFSPLAIRTQRAEISPQNVTRVSLPIGIGENSPNSGTVG